MPEIVLATRNPGKVREMQDLLQDRGWTVRSLQDFPDLPDLPEEGATYRENAGEKARRVAEWTGRLALADDSGLEVEALGGAPGVRSARFLGEGASQEKKNEKLLELLEGAPPGRRVARFVCVLAIAAPEGGLFFCEGACSGRIAEEVRGAGGFGYDPIFWLPQYGLTMAEVDLAVKNQISHRGQALRKALEILTELFAERQGENAGK